jgi:hypothetical protein
MGAHKMDRIPSSNSEKTQFDIEDTDDQWQSSNLWTAQYINFSVTCIPLFSVQFNWKFTVQH